MDTLPLNKEGDELTRKMQGYARHGIPYYIVYDPEGHIQYPALRCFILDLSNKEQPYRLMERAYFPIAELGLVALDGEYEGKSAPWIRWTDGSGNLIPTGAERAALESKRADVEQQRADAEKSRADALAAKLKESGIDPGAG